MVVIRGTAAHVRGGDLLGELDLSAPGTVRLTLYDSLPGRPVEQPPPSGTAFQTVRYEARVGPLTRGSYDVVVARYLPGRHLVVVPNAPVRVEVGGARSGPDSVAKSPEM